MSRVVRRASVESDRGTVLHTVADEPSPASSGVTEVVEVVEDQGAFLLLRLDGDGNCIADTWHLTVDEAVSQAEFEFELGSSGWEEGPP